MMGRKGILALAVISLLLLTGCGVLAVTAGRPYLGFVADYVRSLLAGPQVVQSTLSPDGSFEAYVVERPSFDPPNQALYIERSSGTHFVMVAELVEDVDALRAIQWSPSSDLVAFVTTNHLFVVRTPGFETVKIPLASEFVRYSADRFGTFGGGIPEYKAAELRFPEAGVLEYRLERAQASSGEALPWRQVRMAALLGEPADETPAPGEQSSGLAQDLALSPEDLGAGWTLDAEKSDLEASYYFDRGEDGKAIIGTHRNSQKPAIDPGLIESVSMRGLSQPDQGLVLMTFVAVFHDLAEAEKYAGEMLKQAGRDSDIPDENYTYQDVATGDEAVLVSVRESAEDTQALMTNLSFRKGRVMVMLISVGKYDDLENAPPVGEDRLKEIAEIVAGRIP